MPILRLCGAGGAAERGDGDDSAMGSDGDSDSDDDIGEEGTAGNVYLRRFAWDWPGLVDGLHVVVTLLWQVPISPPSPASACVPRVTAVTVKMTMPRVYMVRMARMTKRRPGPTWQRMWSGSRSTREVR